MEAFQHHTSSLQHPTHKEYTLFELCRVGAQQLFNSCTAILHRIEKQRQILDLIELAGEFSGGRMELLELGY